MSDQDAADPCRHRLLALGPGSLGDRLDVFLASSLGLSRAQVRRLIERGAVSLDGRTLAGRDKGKPLPESGELRIEAFRPPGDERAQAEDPAAGPRVLAEGPGWLALDKPAGMAVHPLREDERGSVLGFVAGRWPQVHGVGEGGLRSGVVHRLDLETSGVLLFATEQQSWQRLRTAFSERRIAKRYRALVLGRFDPPGGRLVMELPLLIARHRPALVRVATADERGRASVRVVEQVVTPVELLADASLVEVAPSTGFLHQIRASLAHLGHPVLGDERYGNERSREVGKRCGADRHLLHAGRVEFEEIVAEAREPVDFRAAVERLRGAERL